MGQSAVCFVAFGCGSDLTLFQKLAKCGSRLLLKHCGVEPPSNRLDWQRTKPFLELGDPPIVPVSFSQEITPRIRRRSRQTSGSLMAAMPTDVKQCRFPRPFRICRSRRTLTAIYALEFH